MHNRPKVGKTVNDLEAQRLQQRVGVYKSLLELISRGRKANALNADNLELLGKMLKINPDFYSLWNYRRETLIHHHPELRNGLKCLSNDIRDRELALTRDCIQKNPKSYCAWYHRIWTIDHFNVDINAEIELCNEFLRLDQRNFHCWNFRRDISHRLAESWRTEMEYSLQKINENFSNYSAFHHRSILLPRMVDSSSSYSNFFAEEFRIVENAIFTEPDDQSAWWYHHYLCCYALKMTKGDDRLSQAELFSLLLCQVELIKSLLEIEAFSSRWALNSFIYTGDILVQNNDLYKLWLDTQPESAVNYTADRTKFLEKLIQIDPNHANRYKYLLNR